MVDDDPLVRMNTVDTLVDAGFSCATADSLAAGFAQLAHGRFDLVVCDHDLGDGKGSSLVKKLAAAGDPTPVICLSGAGGLVEAELAGCASVRRIVQKPATADVLTAAVSEGLAPRAETLERYPRLIGEDERTRLLGDFS